MSAYVFAGISISEMEAMRRSDTPDLGVLGRDDLAAWLELFVSGTVDACGTALAREAARWMRADGRRISELEAQLRATQAERDLDLEWAIAPPTKED